jgi:hypothetical protein
MVIELCSCDWNLGAPLPSHEHATFHLVRPVGEEGAMWTRCYIPQRGWEVLAEVEELILNVPWKVIAKEALVSA